jgi:hypothetical protein
MHLPFREPCRWRNLTHPQAVHPRSPAPGRPLPPALARALAARFHLRARSKKHHDSPALDDAQLPEDASRVLASSPCTADLCT